MKIRFAVAYITLFLGNLCAIADERRPFLTGIDANYVLDLESKGKTYSSAGKADDVYSILARAGCDSFRVRLWTGDEGMNGLNYAIASAKRAKAAGLKPYLVIFLSEDWSDMVKQPLPAVWKSLDEPSKLLAIEAYAERVTKAFADAGIEIDLFEIGNEIDFGICGVFEEEWPKRVSLEYMQSQIWSKMTPIIAAAQKGVKKARPEAKFILHLAQWENADYCIAFWKYMLAAGVAVDVPGLSYFPTSAKPENRTLNAIQKQVQTISAAVGKSVLICETGYPSLPTFPGQFADWNKPFEGYSLEPAGQEKWLKDFLALARGDQHFAGVFYWSPDWYVPGMWEAFALFDEKGNAKPALASFAQPIASSPTTVPATMPATGLKIYFGNLHSHTSYSDGDGKPEEAYAYARDHAKIDFLAITEHNHLLGGEHATPDQRTALYAGPDDAALIPVADKYCEDGRFVAIYGQEFSSMSKGNHVNLYDVPAVIDVVNGKFDELLAWRKKNLDSMGKESVVQLNHPGLGPPNKGIAANEYGRDDFGDDAGWVRNMGDATALIEVANGDPLPGILKKRASQIMEENYKMYLQRGFHVAPTGNQDNHKTNWGSSTDARTAIYAPALTKAALLDAMRARHVYATEDKNLKIMLRINGHLCGDIIRSEKPLESLDVSFDIDDEDEPAAEYTIEAIGGKIDGAMADVTATTTAKGNSSGNVMAGLSLKECGQYVYFRITQKGTETVDRTWTAPVWLELTPAK